MKNKIITIFTVILLLSGCGTMKNASIDAGVIPLPEDKIVPLQIPKPIRTLDIYDSQLGVRVDKDILSLTSKQIRERLTTTETVVTIEKYDGSISLGYLGANAKAAKGRYKITFDYVNSTIKDVSLNKNEADTIQGRIGVGLRITVDLTTTSNGLDLSSLLPIALAVKDEKATGTVRFLAYGLSNEKFSSLLTPTIATLSPDSIQKTIESIGAERIIFNLDETKLEPYLLGISSNVKKP